MIAIILDLCGGSGAWAKPYIDAGYDVRTVTLPDNDVRDYCPPDNVRGILAAPPCTEFSVVRRGTVEKNHGPRNLERGMEIGFRFGELVHHERAFREVRAGVERFAAAA